MSNDIIHFPNGFTSEDKIRSFLRVRKDNSFRIRDKLNGEYPRYFSFLQDNSGFYFWLQRDVDGRIAHFQGELSYSGRYIDELINDCESGDRLELTEKQALSLLNPHAALAVIKILENHFKTKNQNQF